MNYATTSMLSSSSSDVLTGRLCGLMCSSVSVSLLCRLLTCVSRLDDRGAGVWSSIPSGHMHVQPVPEGRSLRDALDHGHFCVCCCSKVCAGNYLPWCDCAVRGFWIDVLWSEHKLSHATYIYCTRASLSSLSVLPARVARAASFHDPCILC